MFQYDTTIDPAAENTSHRLLLDLVGNDKSVLDLGCATGYLGEALAERGCRVTGVEFVEEAAEQARQLLDRVVVGDLNTLDLVAEFGPGSFDVLVFGDVLEHLPDPARVLRAAVPLLAPGGSVVISIPNITHGSIRLAILQGRWQYTETGLLDRTHIRFFTRQSLLDMVTGAGLVPVDVRRTTADPLGVEVEIDPSALPPGLVDWVRDQPDAMTYQFVLRAVHADVDAEVASLADRAARSVERLDRAERQLERERSKREVAEHDLAQVLSTRAFRVLARPRRWYASARRVLGGGRA